MNYKILREISTEKYHVVDNRTGQIMLITMHSHIARGYMKRLEEKNHGK